MTSLAPPTLSGAERGRVRPYRKIEGGIHIFREDGEIQNVPCALRILRQNELSLSFAYARQYVAGRTENVFSPRELAEAEATVKFHMALVQPDAGVQKPEPLFPLPDGIADGKGKVNPILFSQLALWRLADGQLDQLIDEYALLLKTQIPTALTHEQWEAIVKEGKSESLRTLVSRHGSSALIQVLHGTPAEAWQL